METPKTQAPRENPNIINVSNKRNQNFYVFLGKQLLKEHEFIEFQALGNAVSTAVMSAENLVRYVPPRYLTLGRILFAPQIHASLTYLFMFIETTTLSSKRLEPRPSPWREPRKRHQANRRRQSSSSSSLSMRTSTKTSKVSRRSRPRTSSRTPDLPRRRKLRPPLPLLRLESLGLLQ